MDTNTPRFAIEQSKSIPSVYLVIDNNQEFPHGKGILAFTHKEEIAQFIANALNSYKPEPVADAESEGQQ